MNDEIKNYASSGATFNLSERKLFVGGCVAAAGFLTSLLTQAGTATYWLQTEL